ncbi:hypothetical protein [Streptomyces avermitilis]|uniref:hypothetical protein n=1 Tax=Streptomyces avermitilis TaxID=33903 RepID=UPI003F53F74D
MSHTPGAEHLARRGGGEVGVHGDDTVDALAEAHDHRNETRFRDVTPKGDDPVPDLDRDGALVQAEDAPEDVLAGGGGAGDNLAGGGGPAASERLPAGRRGPAAGRGYTGCGDRPPGMRGSTLNYE